MPKIKYSVFLVIFLFIVGVGIVKAQQPLTGVAISVPLNEQNVVDGDIVCSATSGYSLCKNPYDSSMYGVVNETPVASITNGTLPNFHLVITQGEVPVKVTTINGKIKVGDYVTSGGTTGVGQLADKTGYVLGRALEAYSDSDTKKVGTIKVSVAIHAKIDTLASVKQNLVELLGTGFSALGVGPIAALRYVVASTMVLVSFVIGFIYFGRIAKTGVEAIGRNPLAGARIQFSVLVNIVIMVIIALVGLATAYLILVI